MVALIIETGMVVSGANSYVSLQYADDYFAAHPFYASNWDSLTDEVKGNLLVFATATADNQLGYAGDIVQEDQPLRWPRQNVRDSDDRIISSSVIPECLKQGVCEIAVSLSLPGANPDAPSDSAGLTELKVDVITLKFAPSTARAAIPSAAARLFRGLYGPHFNPRVGRVQVRV